MGCGGAAPTGATSERAERASSSRPSERQRAGRRWGVGAQPPRERRVSERSERGRRGRAGASEPDATGRFGEFGGRFVPETLVPACEELEVAFREAWADPVFREELDDILRD